MIIKKKKTSIKFYFISSLLLFFMCFLLYQNFIFFFSFYDLQKESYLLEEKIKVEKSKTETIGEKIDFLDTPIGVRNMIIEQTFTKRPGEMVIEILKK